MKPKKTVLKVVPVKPKEGLLSSLRSLKSQLHPTCAKMLRIAKVVRRVLKKRRFGG